MWVWGKVSVSGWTKRITLERDRYECGVWQVHGQPFNHSEGKRPISASMYDLHLSWVCSVTQPPRAWHPGRTSGSPLVCRILWSHDHGDFKKWSSQSSQPEVLLGTSLLRISELHGKKLEEVSDCLYCPVSKCRVRFWVENVAQDYCKPKKPHLFHGSSLYPQSQEIILLTEKVIKISHAS